jgi:ATP-binding cassette subfamily B protein
MDETLSFRKVLRRVIRIDRAIHLVWKNTPGWTLVQLALVIVQGLLPLAGLYLTKRIVDAISAGIVDADLDATLRQVLFLVGLAAAAALLAAICNSLSDLSREAQSMRVTDAVSDLLHAQSVAVDLGYYEDPQYYDTLHRAQQEAPWRSMQIVWGLTQVVQNSISLVGILVLLLSFNWQLGLILAAAVLPGTVVRFLHAQKRFELQHRQTELDRQAWYFHWLLIDNSIAKELRVFHLGGFFRQRYNSLQRSLRKGQLELANRRVLAEFAVESISTLTVYVTVGLSAYQALLGKITVGDLMLIYLGFQNGLGALQAVLYGFADLYENNLFLKNLFEFLALKPAIQAPADPRPIPAQPWEGIRFENVSFTYPGQSQPALREVNLELKPGEVIALVGENGSGKTTLVKLLCQLYRPTQGKITLDGVSQDCFDPADWMRQFSVIFQDYAQYFLTAGENIWIGDTQQVAERSHIAAAAQKTGADSVIERLPKGYDTPLGNYFYQGHELSIGEWQKVALARLFWREAQIFILDEPASSLDPLAEAKLFEDFRSLLNGRSAILISHRFPTVQAADRIYVLQEGRVIEQGDHAELLRLNGRYAQLYRAQETPYRKSAVNRASF